MSKRPGELLVSQVLEAMGELRFAAMRQTKEEPKLIIFIEEDHYRDIINELMAYGAMSVWNEMADTRTPNTLMGHPFYVFKRGSHKGSPHFMVGLAGKLEEVENGRLN